MIKLSKAKRYFKNNSWSKLIDPSPLTDPLGPHAAKSYTASNEEYIHCKFNKLKISNAATLPVNTFSAHTYDTMIPRYLLIYVYIDYISLLIILAHSMCSRKHSLLWSVITKILK